MAAPALVTTTSISGGAINRWLLEIGTGAAVFYYLVGGEAVWLGANISFELINCYIHFLHFLFHDNGVNAPSIQSICW